jgi:hypothetical protein
MNHPKTCLVLGAGASQPYGYPVGDRLRRSIISLLSNADDIAGSIGFHPKVLTEFLLEFRYAQTASIDTFLGVRGEFDAIGKAAIAWVLLQLENDSKLFEATEDHWYQYLLDVLAENGKWDDFDPSWLSIVTFNYDRSLEHYLCRALRSRYAKSEEEVVERLRALKIVHMYGDLGLPWSGEGYFAYGTEIERHLHRGVTQAIGRLRVIPEGRQDDPCMQQAQTLLHDARKVCVLGFSFDSTNCERLGAPDVFLSSGSKPGPDGYFAPKRMVVTALGLTPAEQARAQLRLFQGKCQYLSSDIFHGTKCRQLMHNTLFLET